MLKDHMTRGLKSFIYKLSSCKTIHFERNI